MSKRRKPVQLKRAVHMIGRKIKGLPMWEPLCRVPMSISDAHIVGEDEWDTVTCGRCRIMERRWRAER